MSGTGEKIPYNKIPVFTMHSDGESTDKKFVAVDANGVSLDIDKSKVAEGVLIIDTVEYYTKSKVDTLLSELEARVKAYADNKDEAVKTWVSSNFQHV